MIIFIKAANIIQYFFNSHTFGKIKEEYSILLVLKYLNIFFNEEHLSLSGYIINIITKTYYK